MEISDVKNKLNYSIESQVETFKLIHKHSFLKVSENEIQGFANCNKAEIDNFAKKFKPKVKHKRSLLDDENVIYYDSESED